MEKSSSTNPKQCNKVNLTQVNTKRISYYVLAGAPASLAAQHLFAETHTQPHLHLPAVPDCGADLWRICLHLGSNQAFFTGASFQCALPLSFAWLIHRWDGPVRPRLRKELFVGHLYSGVDRHRSPWADDELVRPNKLHCRVLFLVGNGVTLRRWKNHLSIKADHPRDHYLWWLTAVAMEKTRKGHSAAEPRLHLEF